jgi:hypothetical protein
MCNVVVGCESNHSNCVPAITTDYVGQYYSCYLGDKNLREKNKSKISRFTFLHLDTIGVKWGPLSPLHDASSGCRWGRRLPDTDSGWKHPEQAMAGGPLVSDLKRTDMMMV